MSREVELVRQMFDDLIKSRFIEMFSSYFNDASCAPLESLCETFRDGDWIESKDQDTEGIRLIQTGNVGISTYLDKAEKARFINDDTFVRLNCTEVLPGDVLISRLPDPIARSCIVPAGLGKSITGVDCTIVRFNKTVNPVFFNQYTLIDHYLSQISTFEAGSTRKRISRKNLGKIKVPLPPIELQNQFASFIEQVDKSKVIFEREVARYDELIKSRFIEMFGNPVTNDRGWSTLKLSEIGKLDRGISKHRPRNDPILLGGPYPLIQTGDVANTDTYLSKYSQTYSETGLKQSKLWKKGTLCITIAANIAKTAILTIDACFPDSIVGFIPNKYTDVLFVHHWFGFIQEILEHDAPQSAQKNINLQILKNLDIITPPIHLQNDFIQFVKQIENSKNELINTTKNILSSRQ